MSCLSLVLPLTRSLSHSLRTYVHACMQEDDDEDEGEEEDDDYAYVDDDDDEDYDESGGRKAKRRSGLRGTARDK